MTRINKVANCYRCPLRDCEMDHCNHPDAPLTMKVTHTGPPPDWCPLRIKALAIVLDTTPKDDHYWSWIGDKVRKKSGKPFKSKEKINTVKWITTNPITGRPAFTFEEDHTSVECRMCELTH